MDVWAAINDPRLLSSRGVGDVKFETVESSWGGSSARIDLFHSQTSVRFDVPQP